MPTVICFPNNKLGLPMVNIYRSDLETDEYSLLDTIPSFQLEYEDPDGTYAHNYKVAYVAADDTESTQIAIKSVAQQVLEIIRYELKLSEDDIPSEEIDFFIQQASIDVRSDICIHVENETLKRLTANIFALPNRYLYDANCAGHVSNLDIDVWKQTQPITVYSPKTILTPIKIDTAIGSRYVEFENPLDSNDVVKLTYYYTTRFVPADALRRLIAYRICTMHYQTISISNSVMTFGSVKIGDISITNPSSTSSSAIQDAYAKMNAKYEKLLKNYRSEFRRKH